MTPELTDQTLLKTGILIDGHWCDAEDRKQFAVTNPATDETIALVPNCGALETRRAIQAANTALRSWRTIAANQRAEILQRWGELMLRSQEDLATILTLEQGKPLIEARIEISAGAAFLQWFAEEAKRVYGDIIPSTSSDRRLFVIKQGIGVCAAITPWNFPCAMIARKVAPALAAGCTMVLKPAEQTPLSALALAELGVRAGMPRGVLNVVTGDPKVIGAEITTNPLVRKLSFTGSTAVGRLLMAQCATTVKRLSLELGGNAPFIVFEDADIDAAVAGAIAAKYRNAGQTCISANRFLVQDSVHEKFAEKFALATEKLKVGQGFSTDTTQGPLINEAAIKKVELLIADAVSKGASIICGGQRHGTIGNFFRPTILGNIDKTMLLTREEIFGPVAPLWRFQEEADAIRIANDTEYGLAAYFYTRDIGRVWRVSEALEFGMVGVNAVTLGSEAAPFGGMKQSGIGREGSKYGIEEYLEIKYLCAGGL